MRPVTLLKATGKARIPTGSQVNEAASSPGVCVSSCQGVPECEQHRISEEDDRGGEGQQEQEQDDRGSDEGFMGMTPLLQAHHAMERMEEFVHKVTRRRTHTHTQWCLFHPSLKLPGGFILLRAFTSKRN